jgi:ABC-type sulfate transport system permease component
VIDSRLAKVVAFIASGSLLLFLVIPLIVILLRAIEVELWQQLQQPTVAQAIRLSLFTSIVSTTITMVLGTPLAYALARRQVRAVRRLKANVGVVLWPTRNLRSWGCCNARVRS